MPVVSEITKREFDYLTEPLAPGEPKRTLTFERHISKMHWFLETRFALGPNANPWDEWELLAYAPQTLRLRDEDEVDQVYINLRAKHTFRPSVGELREAIDALHGVVPPPEPVPGHVVESRKVYTMPEEGRKTKQIEEHTDTRSQNPARLRALAALADLPGRMSFPRLSKEERYREQRKAHGHRDSPMDGVA